MDLDLLGSRQVGKVLPQLKHATAAVLEDLRWIARNERRGVDEARLGISQIVGDDSSARIGVHVGKDIPLTQDTGINMLVLPARGSGGRELKDIAMGRDGYCRATGAGRRESLAGN